MNLFAKFIIYPYLTPNDISMRGLISVEILPITILLAVVRRETRLVPPTIAALIRMKTIVGIANKVDILWAIRQLMPMWPVSSHSSHVTQASTILR
jgi:hypothetical protein